jgi:hypothetical protein
MAMDANTPEHVVRETFVGARFVFSDSYCVSGRSGMREVIRAAVESAPRGRRSLHRPARRWLARLRNGVRLLKRSLGQVCLHSARQLQSRLLAAFLLLRLRSRRRRL